MNNNYIKKQRSLKGKVKPLMIFLIFWGIDRLLDIVVDLQI